jgi:hypothetical protein
MTALKIASAFFGWLMAALLCLSLIQIYGLGRFEDSLGGQWGTLLVSAFVDLLIAMLVTLGFAAALWHRRGTQLRLATLRLAIAGAAAGGLIYAFTFTGLYLSARFQSWALNLSLLTVYALIIGALIGFALVRFPGVQQNAA